MNEKLLKIMCFFTGYNFILSKESSEKCKLHIKKYFSALIMIIPIWGFIGYNFINRYLKGNYLESSLGALFLGFLIWQIERQIIMADKKSIGILIFRGALATIASILGAIIIDQIILKDDIEKNKIEQIQADVNRILPSKTAELDNQIEQLNELLQKKELERAEIMEDINKRPMIITYQKKTKQERDEESQSLIPVSAEHQTFSVENPKMKLIPVIDEQINKIQENKREIENKKINIRTLVEEELKSKTGFIEELNIIFKIIMSSHLSLVSWLLIFLFFFFIELFVLINKWTNEPTDYEELLNFQETIRKRKIQMLHQEQDGVSSSTAEVLQYN
jgi:outer membrane murein-binding lipoprotein Lpp